MGFTRKQSILHKKTKLYNRILLPLINPNALDKMSPNLRLIVSRMVSVANGLLQDLLSDHTPLPYSNKKKNQNI